MLSRSFLLLLFTLTAFFGGCQAPPPSLVPDRPVPAALPVSLPPNVRAIPVNAVQGDAYIHDLALARVTPENARIQISLARQRAYFYAGDELALETPISTGVPAHPTPAGSYRILEKKAYHESTLYGNYVDARGNVVLANVSSRTNKAPPGAKWSGTAVPYWQRLTWDGVGMHVGKLPGEPASHGCLRFPSTVMPLIYERTKVGTPVVIE